MTQELLSRRRFAGAACASLSFLTCAPRAQPPDNARISTATDPAAHLTIAVEINGRSFRFVVDTGADRSVLADTTAEALGLQPAGAVMLAGIVRTVRAETVPVDEISFGPATRRGLQLPVLPRRHLQADGYLGLDVLDGSRVILDFANQELIVTDPLPYLLSVYAPRDAIILRAQGEDGHLRAAKCSVNNHYATAFIDTGAESTMGNEALYRALVEADPAAASRSSITLTGLTGGIAEGHLTFPREARIGSLSISNCPIAIADLQVFEIWGLKDRPALLIGMNWLRRFRRVSIDYGLKELRFETGRSAYGATIRTT